MSDEDEIVERYRKHQSRRVGLDALASQLCDRLDAIGGEQAKELSAEGRKHAGRLQGWTDLPPPPDQRMVVLTGIADFNQRALQYLAEVEGPDASPPEDRRDDEDDD